MGSPQVMLFLLVCSGALILGVLQVVKKYYLSVHKVHEDVMVVGLMAFADFPSSGLVEICLVGGQMQVFQKQNLQMSIEDRERVLLESIDDAFRTSTPDVKPVKGLSAQYVVRKR